MTGSGVRAMADAWPLTPERLAWLGERVRAVKWCGANRWEVSALLARVAELEAETRPHMPGDPLPPEMLLADPALMASPEGDAKGLAELRAEAQAQIDKLGPGASA